MQEYASRSTGITSLGKIDNHSSNGRDTDSRAYHRNNSRNDYSRNSTFSVRADDCSSVYGQDCSHKDNIRGGNMHLVLQLLHLQANLKITCQTDVTLTVVRTIATIQEMTILETVRLQAALIIVYQSIAALVYILSNQKWGYNKLLIIWF